MHRLRVHTGCQVKTDGTVEDPATVWVQEVIKVVTLAVRYDESWPSPLFSQHVVHEVGVSTALAQQRCEPAAISNSLQIN